LVAMLHIILVPISSAGYEYSFIPRLLAVYIAVYIYIYITFCSCLPNNSVTQSPETNYAKYYFWRIKIGMQLPQDLSQITQDLVPHPSLHLPKLHGTLVGAWGNVEGYQPSTLAHNLCI